MEKGGQVTAEQVITFLREQVDFCYRLAEQAGNDEITKASAERTAQEMATLLFRLMPKTQWQQVVENLSEPMSSELIERLRAAGFYDS